MALDEFLGLISQVGVRMLETAVWGTYYNVTTNLSDLKDQEFKTQASTMFENVYYKISIYLVIYSQDAHVLYVDKYIQMVNILHDLYKVVFKSVIFVFSSFEKKNLLGLTICPVVLKNKYH